MTNNEFCIPNTKTQIQNKKANIKDFVRPGNRTRDLWHRSLMRYLPATQITDHTDCSQAY